MTRGSRKYTRFRDKNGKKVYEGDLVRFEYSAHSEGWHGGGINPGATVKWSTVTNSWYLGGNCSVGIETAQTGEVIGNVWDNPELENPELLEEAK